MGRPAAGNLPLKECGTPDTEWGAVVTPHGADFTMDFPVDLILDEDKKRFIAEIHASIVPVVERMYRKRWKEKFSGKRDKEGRLYPEKYEDLWPDRKVQSKE